MSMQLTRGTPFSNATPADVTVVGSAGTAVTAARGDHVHAGAPPVTQIATQTLAGAATSVSFTTGIDLEADTQYLIAIKWVAAQNGGVRMYVNNDTTEANYYVQDVINTGATVTAARDNNAVIMENSGATDIGSVLIHLVKDAGDFPIATIRNSRATTAVSLVNFSSSWVHNSTTNVTRIDFTSGAANGMGIGTQITIYKLG